VEQVPKRENGKDLYRLTSTDVALRDAGRDALSQAGTIKFEVYNVMSRDDRLVGKEASAM
jgi:hypothetical protein